LTKGVPIRLKESPGYSVDASIAAFTLTRGPVDGLTRVANPYYGANEPFSARRFRCYLVTRLDGYTSGDCRRLVDEAMIARPESGPFLFDEADNRNGPDYSSIQEGLGRAADVLQQRGFSVILDRTSEFVAPVEQLAGYASWGSNDAAFAPSRYKSLRFR